MSTHALSTADKVFAAIMAGGCVAVVVHSALAMLLDVIAAFDAVALPQPFDQFRLGSVVCGCMLSVIVSVISTIYRAQCSYFRQAREYAICRD